MHLPKGKWYNLWTDEVVKGGKEIWLATHIDSMPIFIKEAALIPKYLIPQYVGENKFDQITLDIYYKEGKEKSQLYADTSDGSDYKKGRYRLHSFKLTGKK